MEVVAVAITLQKGLIYRGCMKVVAIAITITRFKVCFKLCEEIIEPCYFTIITGLIFHINWEAESYIY